MTSPRTVERTRTTTSPRAVLQKVRRETPAALIGVVMSVLVIIPVIFIIIAAFSTAVPRPGNTEIGTFTLENFSIFATPQGLESLFNSLIVGVGSAAVSLAIGALLAFIAARTDAPWRRFIYIAGIAPMFLPALVGALAWSLLGSPSSGFFNVLLRDLGIPITIDVYSLGGLIFVLGLFYAPYSFLLTYSSFAMMNADLEEAASIHGAGLRTMFRTVTLPLAIPALAGSAILTFVLAMENFPIAAILGNPAGIETLPTYIYRLMSSSPVQANTAAGIAIALTALVAVITFGQQLLVNRRRYTTLTGKGSRPRPVRLKRLRWVATGFAIAYFALAVVFPILALVITSTTNTLFLPSFANLFDNGFSFKSIIDTVLKADFQLALTNSVIVAVVAALVGTVISFSASYVRYRTKSKLGQFLEQVAMAPLAIPSIVLGIGILWTWLTLPFPVYGTLAILIIGCVALSMPQSYRSVSASMLQLDADLENSAIMLGANRLQAIRSITIPLMRAGIASTVLMLLMLCMRELTAALFLYTSKTRILSILVYQSFENGSITFAASASLVFIFVIGVLAITAQLIGVRDQRIGGES